MFEALVPGTMPARGRGETGDVAGVGVGVAGVTRKRWVFDSVAGFGRSGDAERDR